MGAAGARAVEERIGWMFEVIRAAAPVDPDIEALWRRIETEFHANQRVVVASIGAKDALRPGLDVDRATDILWTLNHPVVWQLLVIQRGWTPDAVRALVRRRRRRAAAGPAPRVGGRATAARHRLPRRLRGAVRLAVAAGMVRTPLARGGSA